MAQQGDLREHGCLLKGQLILLAAAVVDNDNVGEACVYQSGYNCIQLVGGSKRGKYYSALYVICNFLIHNFTSPLRANVELILRFSFERQYDTISYYNIYFKLYQRYLEEWEIL